MAHLNYLQCFHFILFFENVIMYVCNVFTYIQPPLHFLLGSPPLASLPTSCPHLIFALFCFVCNPLNPK